MQTEKIASKYLPNKAMLIMRTVVGVYLLYTAFCLIDGLKSTHGGELAFLCVAMVAFVIFGVGFIVVSLKGLRIGKYKGGAMDAGEETNVAETVDMQGISEEQEISKMQEIPEGHEIPKE